MEPLPPTGKITPYDYQRDAYTEITKAIRNYQGPVFVEASVGAGKTIMMSMVASRAQQVGMDVWVLARRGELVEQNSETLWVCDVKNSIYSASCNSKSTHYPVVVGSEGTICRALNKELDQQRPTLILVDECHEVDYEKDESQYMQILNEMQRRNPKLRVIGFTGSPYRGSEDIIGDFWRHCIYKVRTPELVDRGFLVPTFFGYEQQQAEGYHLEDFHVHAEDDNSDFSQKELLAMQRIITKDSTTTQRIMAEVVKLTASRNAVMITGSGKKHLEQIAECLPKDSYAIITDSTGSTERRRLLKEVRDGKRKYVLQIGCLTTGFDAPLIDTSVIMRKIGSLTLLIQLLGRGMRLLKPEHKEAGYIKTDHLVLDYSDTMEEMGDKYDNPILEKAQKQKSEREKNVITCPVCSTINSDRAKRCINSPKSLEGVIRLDVQGVENYSIDGRCEWFWDSAECSTCKTKNSSVSKECRKCGELMKDPDINLKGKHYTDNDFQPVKKMTMKTTKNGDGIIVDYFLASPPGEFDRTKIIDGEELVVASEIFHPSRQERWAKGPWWAFLKAHLHKSWHGKVSGKRAGDIVRMASAFDVPTHITHRRRQDKKSIIHRKKFLSGRES